MSFLANICTFKLSFCWELSYPYKLLLYRGVPAFLLSDAPVLGFLKDSSVSANDPSGRPIEIERAREIGRQREREGDKMREREIDRERGREGEAESERILDCQGNSG